MKKQQLANAVGLYFALLYHCVPSFAAWGLSRFALSGTALGAIGYACASGGAPACAIAAAASLLILVFNSWAGGELKGMNVGNVRAVAPGKRSEYEVFHEIGDGMVQPFLDIDSLVTGVEHRVWDNNGNVFRASRHESGSPMVSIDLEEPMQLSNKRSAGTITAFTITFDAPTAYGGGTYAQSDANADAQRLLQTYSTGQGSYVCTTSTDDDSQNTINYSFTPTSSSGIYPRSGFASCSA